MPDPADGWIKVEGRPVPFARPSGKGKRYTPREYADWKQLAVEFMRLVYRVPELGTEAVYADVVVGSAALWARLGPLADIKGFWAPKGWGVRPTGVRGDLDNYVKATLDAAQDARWIADDRQVMVVRACFLDENGDTQWTEQTK